MGAMVRFFLALLLAIATVGTPARALCSYAEPAEMTCCCCSEPAECAQVVGSCCDMQDSSNPALPQPTSQAAVNPGVPLVSSAPTFAYKVSSAAGVPSRCASLTKPLHLASNKIYLRHRALLI